MFNNKGGIMNTGKVIKNSLAIVAILVSVVVFAQQNHNHVWNKISESTKLIGEDKVDIITNFITLQQLLHANEQTVASILKDPQKRRNVQKFLDWYGTLFVSAINCASEYMHEVCVKVCS